MPRLLTLTANLLWEQTLWFNDWHPGRTQRATRSAHQVGGKGINVAKMLARLGADHAALCFPGGATGAVAEAWLRERGLTLRSFAAPRPETRTGLVVRSPHKTETTFLGPDEPLAPAAVAAAAAALEAEPALCKRWRGPLVADTYGPPLRWLVDRPLALVKINRAEFDRLMPPSDDSELDFTLRLAEAAGQWPVAAWVVSDGPRAVWCALKDGTTQTFRPPPVREVSPTGSGDVLLAALLHAHFNLGQPWGAAVEFALPLAAANAAHEGIAEFPLNLPAG